MSDDLETTLVKLYKAMPSATIESRLATAELTQLARGVAQNELQKRAARAERGEAATPVAVPAAQADQDANPGTPPSHMGPIAFVVFSVLAAGLSSLIVPDFAWLFGFTALATVASFLSKAYPRVGLAIGSALLLAAAGLVLWWLLGPSHHGLEVIIYAVVTWLGALLLGVMGWSMVDSARDKQPWDQFIASWEAKRKK
ncbi:MAG: hypothetical protein ACJ8GW_02575 [Massilia sp.]